VVLHPAQHKIGHFRDIAQANLWFGMEKLNLTQQKNTFTNQKELYNNTKQTQKTKARFSRLLRHPAWKWRGPILVSALHKSVTYLLTYSSRPTRGHNVVQ